MEEYIVPKSKAKLVPTLDCSSTMSGRSSAANYQCHQHQHSQEVFGGNTGAPITFLSLLYNNIQTIPIWNTHKAFIMVNINSQMMDNYFQRGSDYFL